MDYLTEELVNIECNQLFISPTEDKKVIFEETLLLMDVDGQVVDEVTVDVETEDQMEDRFMVYQYSREESHMLRVRSLVNRSLDTELELRQIKQLDRKKTLSITNTTNEYKVLKLLTQGRHGSREYNDVAKSSVDNLFLEGSNIILLRKLAVGQLFGQFRGQTINHEGELCECLYEVERGERHDVRVRRTVSQEVMTTLLTEEGRILLHKWSGSERYLVSIYRGDQQPPDEEEATQKAEVLSSEPELKADKDAYFEKKEALIQLMKVYLLDHSDVADMIADLFKELLFEKPDDVIDFADRYLSEFMGIVREPVDAEPVDSEPVDV